jgi:hypothetical protein
MRWLLILALVAVSAPLHAQSRRGDHPARYDACGRMAEMPVVNGRYDFAAMDADPSFVPQLPEPRVAERGLIKRAIWINRWTAAALGDLEPIDAPEEVFDRGARAIQQRALFEQSHDNPLDERDLRVFETSESPAIELQAQDLVVA